MLVIEDLKVELGGKILLDHIDLEIKPGETHILFGPNGSGKTSLLMTIMGYPQYKVVAGKMTFRGADITYMPINERAKLGIGMSYQRPPTINGLKTRQMVKICGKGETDVEGLAKRVNFSEFLDRDVNAGFSGGEIKRSELLQLMAQSRISCFLTNQNQGWTWKTSTWWARPLPSFLRRTLIRGARQSQRCRRRENGERWGSSSPIPGISWTTWRRTKDRCSMGGG